MSRDAIAEVLARLDYGDHPDDVDRADRLREVDWLLSAGVVVDVDHLVTDGAQHLWHDLRRTLLPLGWCVVVSWVDHDLVLAWAPPHVTPEHLDSLTGAYVTAEAYGDGTANVVYHPPLPPDHHPYEVHFEPNADALLTWLAAS